MSEPKYTKRLDPGAEHANRLAADKLLKGISQDGHGASRQVDWARLAADAGLGSRGGDSNRDADTVNDDDYGPIITEEGTCSNCLYKIPLDDLRMLDFYVEESGVQPGTPDGPTQYWATGYIVCPNCGVQLPYETSS